MAFRKLNCSCFFYIRGVKAIPWSICMAGKLLRSPPTRSTSVKIKKLLFLWNWRVCLHPIKVINIQGCTVKRWRTDEGLSSPALSAVSHDHFTLSLFEGSFSLLQRLSIRSWGRGSLSSVLSSHPCLQRASSSPWAFLLSLQPAAVRGSSVWLVRWVGTDLLWFISSTAS